MRYEDLDLPMGGAALHLHFNPRLTILAGLDPGQRAGLIDAICNIHAGIAPDAHLSVVDMNGRPRIIDAHSASSDAPRTSAGWASALTFDADDLGLPTGIPDRTRRVAERELDTATARVDALRAELAAAEHAADHAARLRTELADCHRQIADAGSSDDAHQQLRARTLVRVEQIRTQLAALDAPASQRARDDRLLAATAETSRLATEWAQLADHLDHLRAELLDHRWPDDDELGTLVRVPPSIPVSLIENVEARDRLHADRAALTNRLEHELSIPPPEDPADPRIQTLALVDQENLWMTHRAVMMATEALDEARRAEKELHEADPATTARIDGLHRATTEADETVERRWLASILAIVVALCVAALLPVAEFQPVTALIPLAVASIVAVGGLVVPRIRARRAPRAEQALLAELGVADIGAYHAQLDDDPQSERWRRAERIIANYETAQAEWYQLVGSITPEEATGLEAEVTRWATDGNPGRRRRNIAALERGITQADEELGTLHRKLRPALVPYGIDPDTDGLADALTRRVADGAVARLVRDLADAEEAEAKVTARLESELHLLGFEAGDLSARIAAFGTALDAADRRDRLRRQAPPRQELEAEEARLSFRLAQTPPPVSTNLSTPDRPIDELRRRAAQLERELARVDDPDLAPLRRRVDAAETHAAQLAARLATDNTVAVNRPVDHLVDTLVRYRPGSGDPGSEPLPAILDDPLAATPLALKRQLLDALVVVSELVQIVLLTDDPDVLAWGRHHTGHAHIDLIAPGHPAR